ncbi:hypothetical protein [Bradyrhizobium sp. 169]|uniref:hypothetical protein n=1 Tax=Bradyrhizobium sp. 169 TaxID=2782640 RepID=UPI001FF9B60B|nr:hypothetical protein [Bradyrhizobium sp. 169]
MPAFLTIRLSAGRAAALELDAIDGNALCSSGMTTHVNSVQYVTIIAQVVNDMGEDEE